MNRLLSRKNVVDVTLGVFHKGLDELMGLSCGVRWSFDGNYTAACCLLSIGINVNVRSSCFTDSIDIASSSSNHTADN